MLLLTHRQKPLELGAEKPEASGSTEQEIWDLLAMSAWDAGVRAWICVPELA